MNMLRLVLQVAACQVSMLHRLRAQDDAMLSEARTLDLAGCTHWVPLVCCITLQDAGLVKHLRKASCDQT